MLRARAARAVLAIGISVLATLMSTGSAQAAEPTTYPVKTTTMATAQANGSSAQRATTNGLADCPANSICFYDQPNYQGQMWYFSLPNNTVYCYGTFTETTPFFAWSAYNNTGGRLILYLAPECSLFRVQTSLDPYQGWPGNPGYIAWYFKRN